MSRWALRAADRPAMVAPDTGRTSPDPPAAGILVRGLEKRFGEVRALDGLELHVARGEVVALLGRNGAGKTTLMRVLGTTLRPDAGVAEVAGHDRATATGWRFGAPLGSCSATSARSTGG